MQLITSETRKVLLDSFYRSSDTHWIIKCDGKYVVLNSGKSSWKTKGHARNALVSHCRSSYSVMQHIAKHFNIVINGPWYEKQKEVGYKIPEFIDILIKDKLIEIVEINNVS